MIKMSIFDNEFNKASLESSKFEKVLIENGKGNKEDLFKKKLELLNKYNLLLTDEEHMGYINEYRDYLSEKIKENKLEAYM